MEETEESKKQEFERRLDEIGAKFTGELTEEQKIQKELELNKLAKESLDEFNKIWKTLSRKAKRKLVPEKNKFSARAIKRLK